MQFMVIEHFDPARLRDVYRRFDERGRMMPDGLKYVSSWIAADFSRCFQIMECENASLLQEWVLAWGDLVRFEIVPIASSQETAEAVRKHL